MSEAQNKMSNWIRAKMHQISILSQKAKKEALKLSLAVVITEGVMVGVFAFALNHGLYEYFQPKTIVIINQVEAKTEKIDEEQVNRERIADYIWLRESTRGTNNYSKCEAQGKINGIGYGIYDGKYICFESHKEEMRVLDNWIKEHENQNMSEEELLNHYSGGSY